jgi:hypothetical protein
MLKKIIILLLIIGLPVLAMCQGVGINTNTPDANSMLEVKSTNQGILIPRIDYNNRPSVSVASGTLIYVIANGPSGDNAFYYYNDAAWVKIATANDNQQLALSTDTLSLSNSNAVVIGDVFPVQGFIKCGTVYINKQTDATNCGSCGNTCLSGHICVNGICQ